MADRRPIYDLLAGLPTQRNLEPLKSLFWEELSYNRINQPLLGVDWPTAAKDSLKQEPLLFAAGGVDDAFHIIYSQLASDKLLKGHERLVVEKLLQDHPYSLFIFSNKDNSRWHLLNVKAAKREISDYNTQPKKRPLFRRITIEAGERLRTAMERISLLDLADLQPNMFGIAPLEIQKRHDDAFDVEAVSKQFYEEYKIVFRALQDDLFKQTDDLQWAHDYALQFLNRIMFLHFIQKKRWLGDDKEFLQSFWNAYNDSKGKRDSFFKKWLGVLFFKAFNGEPLGAYNYFPEGISDIIAMAPYLNGGLFRENRLDDQHNALISDKLIGSIFEFFGQYNFTISEDSPIDQEVAVDPEMIGKVYESLVNVSPQSSDRGDSGIFYTPRTEIDLMCRLSLVDNLSNHLGEKHKEQFYELIFAFKDEEKEEAIQRLAKANALPELRGHLTSITVLDPACGSGSFLVGMLYILSDLLTRINAKLGKSVDSFRLRRDIIGRSLYGVDVMEWACHVAELRLWLALIIDADFTKEELHIRKDPLLPNFTFKIRQGDSLVQEIGGINLSHVRGARNLSSSLVRKISELKIAKLKHYENISSGGSDNDKLIKKQELDLFRNIIAEEEKYSKDRIASLKGELEKAGEQIALPGMTGAPSKQLDAIKSNLEKQIIDFQAKATSLSEARQALVKNESHPFVWDIAFVEIFEGEKQGFDIVIGNPPYVRQEKIFDPQKPDTRNNAELKKTYKAKLCRSIYQCYPSFFGYDHNKDNVINRPEKAVSHKIDGKSDIYIFFYFHGLSLLNENGSFCFITSNSWLDVGYGRDLQEFLMKRCHVKMIIDNRARRSFSDADVNTIIALFSAPGNNDDIFQHNTARFVMFSEPFENILIDLSTVFFEEIEDANERLSKQEFKVHPIEQKALYLDGAEKEEISGRQTTTGPLIKVVKYIGNKWGGKYLRAPDIYWQILKKGKDKLVPLNDVADVRRGITTGANEFFYLDKEKIAEWEIEDEFLKPVILSPRECISAKVEIKNLKNKAFLCDIKKNLLKGSNALKYIQWGERNGYNERASCNSRGLWYELPNRDWAKILWPMIHNDRLCAFWNAKGFVVDHNLFEISGINEEILWGSLTWTAQVIFRELFGRANLGQGALKTEGIDIIKFMALNTSDSTIAKQISAVRISMMERPIKGISEDIKYEDRKHLDEIIFNILGLTKDEREDTYEAGLRLVEMRLAKARSLQ